MNINKRGLTGKVKEKTIIYYNLFTNNDSFIFDFTSTV